MSIQAHLAELEKKHQALETELSDALAHPSVDDTTIAELKRRKLHVKDDLARLKQNESASVHSAPSSNGDDRRRAAAAERHRIFQRTVGSHQKPAVSCL